MSKITFVIRQSGRVVHPSRFHVSVRVSHRSKTCYFDTGIIVGTHERNGKATINFRDGFVTKEERNYIRLNEELGTILTNYERRLVEIRNPGLLSCDEICNHLRCVRNVQSTLTAWFKEYLVDKNTKYVQMVHDTIRYWNEFDDINIPLRCITPDVIIHFRNHLTSRIKSNGHHMSIASVGKALSHVKAVVRYAEANGAVRYDVNPFARTKIERSPSRDCAISPKDVARFRDAHLSCMGEIRARDVWFLSFYLGGINYADLVNIDFRYTTIEFVRQKTRRSINRSFCLPIIEDAWHIIDKYMDRNTGLLNFGLNYSDTTDALRCIGRSLRHIRAALSLPPFFCYYSARHTFAQACRNAGVDVSVREYMMAHAEGGSMSYYGHEAAERIHQQWRMALDKMHDDEKVISRFERYTLRIAK